jgi:hypothetical protein
VAITLAALRARAESVADQPVSAASGTPISIVQFNDFVNDGVRHAYNNIIDIHRDFRITQQATFTVTGPTNNFNALPTDFRAVRAVMSDPGTTYEDFLPMYALRSARGARRRCYLIRGTNLYVEPSSYCQGTYALLYNPIAPVLPIDASVLDSDLEQFQDVIVLQAAMMALTRMDWDIATVAGQLGAATDYLKKWAANQRSADPPRIEDVRRGPRRSWV